MSPGAGLAIKLPWTTPGLVCASQTLWPRRAGGARLGAWHLGPRQGRHTPTLSSPSGPTHAKEHCAEEPRSVCAVAGFVSFGGGWTVPLSSLSSRPGPRISFGAAIQSTLKWVTLHHGNLLSPGLDPGSPTWKCPQCHGALKALARMCSVPSFQVLRAAVEPWHFRLVDTSPQSLPHLPLALYISVCVSLLRRTSVTGDQGPSECLHLDYTCKNTISKEGHIRRYQG